jgi:hypothetical protein
MWKPTGAALPAEPTSAIREPSEASYDEVSLYSPKNGGAFLDSELKDSFSKMEYRLGV